MRSPDLRRLAAAIVIVCAPCLAVSDELDRCMEDANTQRAMERCAHVAFQEAQKKLDIVYQGHLRKLEEEQQEAMDSQAAEGPVRARKLLRESQALWAKYRSVNCELHGARWWPGTMEALERELCLVQMTVDRAKELASVFEAQ